MNASTARAGDGIAGMSLLSPQGRPTEATESDASETGKSRNAPRKRGGNSSRVGDGDDEVDL